MHLKCHLITLALFAAVNPAHGHFPEPDENPAQRQQNHQEE